MEQQQLQSIQNYKKHGITISKVEEDTVVIKQEKLINGYILNQKQLVDIAKSIFPDFKAKPVVYGINTDEVTIEWIKAKMKEYGVKKNDFVKQIAIDKSSLDLILISEKEPSKTVKALFYYFFLTLEINRDFRNDENFIESDKSQKLYCDIAQKIKTRVKKLTE